MSYDRHGPILTRADCTGVKIQNGNQHEASHWLL